MRKDSGEPVEDRNYIYNAKFEEVDVPEVKRINRETAERCLFFLAQSSEAHAAWSARRKFLDKYVGIVLAMEESKQQTGSAADKRGLQKGLCLISG